VARRPERTSSLPVADPWYRDGLNFRCSACGNCCTGPKGYVWVTDEEVAKMAAHRGEIERDFRRHHVRKVQGRLSLREDRNEAGEYDCRFLKPLPGDRPGRRKRGCSIYEVRPRQCRTWPFWDGVVGSAASWQAAKQTCPGMDDVNGRRFEPAEIDRLRAAEDWPERPPSSDPA
jgi:Fe-S-cluster containining protein